MSRFYCIFICQVTTMMTKQNMSRHKENEKKMPDTILFL
jgi:hypothetical protein